MTNLTPLDRARNVLLAIGIRGKEAELIIAAGIEAACAEARYKAQIEFTYAYPDSIVHRWFQDGFNTAKERAAEIAYTSNNWKTCECGPLIAIRIRNMEMGEK